MAVGSFGSPRGVAVDINRPAGRSGCAVQMPTSPSRTMLGKAIPDRGEYYRGSTAVLDLRCAASVQVCGLAGLHVVVERELLAERLCSFAVLTLLRICRSQR